MLTFLAIALFGLIALIGGSLFGHDHDHDFSHDHDFGHDHDGDHDSGDEPTVSIFSMKVIATFIMGFGAAGCIAKYYGTDNVLASLAGMGTGVVMGLVMYGVLRLIYGQQSTSLVRTEEAVGKDGVVTTGIDANSTGQVEVAIGDLRRSYLAQAPTDKSFPRGVKVKVVGCQGSKLLVDKG